MNATSNSAADCDPSLTAWQHYLESIPPVLDLPIARPRQPGQNFQPAHLRVAVPEALTASLAQLGTTAECPVQHLVLTALLLLLHRYSTQDDLLIGTDGRSLAVPGNGPDNPYDFLVLRVSLAGNPGFQELTERVIQAIESCLKQKPVAFTRLVSHLGAESTSYHPIVQTGFSCAVREPGDLVTETSLRPLDLALTLDTGASGFSLTYDRLLYSDEAIERLGGHLICLLESACASPGREIMTLAMLPAHEHHQLTLGWNRTEADFPQHLCLHQLIEANVDAHPDAMAVICDDETLTYAELEARSNRLANHLRRHGVGPNRLVGLSVERSLEMVVGLIGIAKAGGAYLPLDPSYPPERLTWMLADAGPQVLLTLERLSDRFEDCGITMVLLDSEWPAIAVNSDSRPDAGATAEDLVYVIYTSGSTGKPKGVMLNHRGRVNNFLDFNRRYSVGPGDRLISLSSLSFDMTAYDVFGVLSAGASIVMPRAELEKEPGHWAHLIRLHEVTVWHSAPALLEMLVGHVQEQPALHPRSLRLCLLGGDWIPVSLPDRLRAMAEDVHVVSMGGATEASMDSTIYDIGPTDPAWTSIPYGVPMTNQLAYVLDPYCQATPISVPGELYLGGIGVGWGYLERPSLTAEKFVPNPFSGVPGDRIYRTGDLARYQPDGNLELLGRMDYQVKIRGHRIELGEIESTLKEHPSVSEAVVIAKGDRAGDRRLVGYVIPAQGTEDGEEATSRRDKEQVNDWQAVYDVTYGQESRQPDPTFNIIGWNSSFTGLPIPEEEMREWVNATVERIQALRPRRILEIGCGTGLLLFRLAPGCERYVGLDISRVGLDNVQQQLDQRGLSHVSLLHQSAEDLSGIDLRSFDLVILNSITQLFPSIEYLLQVLKGAVEAVAPGGFVFVGDNRNLRLAEALHTSIQLSQAPASVPLADLPDRIRKSIDQEEQLLVDPRFFQALVSEIPRISTATVQIKHGAHYNELTRYRYDVVFSIEAEAQPVSVRPLSWADNELNIGALRRILTEEQPSELWVSAIPNTRLHDDRRILDGLTDATEAGSVGSLRSALQEPFTDDGLDPEQLWTVANEIGYEAFLGYSESWGDLYFDAVLRPRKDHFSPPQMPAERIPPTPWAGYANQPLKGKITLKLPPRLRQFLSDRLPDYMVPASFVLMDRLPLTPNGKVDRKNLPEPDYTRPELDAPMMEPRDALERVLAQIWEEILGVDRVGVLDPFLELGGHSLLATQIQSRIHALLPVEISLRHFFGALTVEQLAQSVREAGREAGTDVEIAADLVLQYGELSIEEIKAALEGGLPSESIQKGL